MAIVTITRGKYSGGEEIAQSVAETLGYRCVSDEALREAAHKYHIPEDQFERAFDSAPSFAERITERSRIFVGFARATLAEWSRDNKLVYHGNSGQELLRGVPTALKVRLIYPIAERVKRITERFELDEIEANRLVRHIDDDRTKRVRFFFNADWRDASRYDLSIHMGTISAQTACQMIVDAARQPEFELSDRNRGAFLDAIAQAQVDAALANTLPNRIGMIEAKVDGGTLTFSGAIPEHSDALKAVFAQCQEIEGVEAVINRIQFIKDFEVRFP